MRYSLRTLLILMLLVGPLCIWGWPAYESWRDERVRVAKDMREIKRLQQSIAILDQRNRIAGGTGLALNGKETIDQLRRIEADLQYKMELVQLQAQLVKLTQLNSMQGGGTRALTAEEAARLREMLSQSQAGAEE
jgi:hypothetical protein